MPPATGTRPARWRRRTPRRARRRAPALARRQVDGRDLPGFHAKDRVKVLRRRPWADDEHVGLVGRARLADLAGDHLEPGVGAKEPAAHLLDAAQRARAIAHVDAH